MLAGYLEAARGGMALDLVVLAVVLGPALELCQQSAAPVFRAGMFEADDVDEEQFDRDLYPVCYGEVAAQAFGRHDDLVFADGNADPGEVVEQVHGAGRGQRRQAVLGLRAPRQEAGRNGAGEKTPAGQEKGRHRCSMPANAALQGQFIRSGAC